MAKRKTNERGLKLPDELEEKRNKIMGNDEEGEEAVEVYKYEEIAKPPFVVHVWLQTAI